MRLSRDFLSLADLASTGPTSGLGLAGDGYGTRSFNLRLPTAGLQGDVDGGIDGGGKGDNGGKVDDLAPGGHVANSLYVDPTTFR